MTQQPQNFFNLQRVETTGDHDHQEIGAEENTAHMEAAIQHEVENGGTGNGGILGLG